MLGITIGDAAGVGPEIILRAFQESRAGAPGAIKERFVVYGDTNLLRAAAGSLHERGVLRQLPEIVAVSSPLEAMQLSPRLLPVMDHGPTQELATIAASPRYPWGEPIAAFGMLQHAALLGAVDDAMQGRIRALVTAPLHKARLADAGIAPTGHTEILERRTGADRAVMLLCGDVLRVALATVHIPLRDVASTLKTDDIESVARTLHDALHRHWGIARPRIAVLGLNPHAGESGVMGDEEQRVIEPALARLRASGIDVSGPWPADTLFPLVAHGRVSADGIVAMYHDQGLGPLKTFHFGHASNVTLGLPIIRTSVDHGTAYDIAGTGEASISSLEWSANLASWMADHGHH